MPEELLKPNSDKALNAQNSQPQNPPPQAPKRRRGFKDLMRYIARHEQDSFLCFIVSRIIAPRVIDSVEDVIREGTDRVLHPDGRRSTNYNYSSTDVPYRTWGVGYNDIFDNSRRYEPPQPQRYDLTPDPRTVEFADKITAEKVLADMKEAIYYDRFCSIQQFYELSHRHTAGTRWEINIAPNHTDGNWGWTNLDGIRPTATYNGRYVIRFPQTEAR